MSIKRTRLDPNIKRKQVMGFTSTVNQLACPNYIMADTVILIMINELNSNWFGVSSTLTKLTPGLNNAPHCRELM